MSRLLTLVALISLVTCNGSIAQEQSVRPGINDTFRDPNVKEFVERFEIESREVFAKRHEIVKCLGLTKGMSVADVGAGTGLFTRMFAAEVGPEGQVLAVDIAQKFIEHVTQSSREAGLKNVQGVLCTVDDSKLPRESVDAVYICDTYHHFEFPQKTMTSIHKALKAGGKVYLIDFKRVEGESTDWTMKHVRAGQEVFETEILSCGFKKVNENKELLKENYFVVFEKVSQVASR